MPLYIFRLKAIEINYTFPLIDTTLENCQLTVYMEV